jgi:hypothetical protein
MTTHIDPLELAQYVAAGALMATVDGVDYRTVHLIAYLDDAAEPHIYCTTEQWRQSVAGRLAERDRLIAELDETLERQRCEVLKQCQRAVAAETRAAELEQLRAAAQAPTPQPRPKPPERQLPPGRVACPHCDKTPWQIQLADHIRRHHPVTTIQATPENAAALSVATIKARLGVAPDWHCAGCERDDRPQSIKNPAYCIVCAKGQPIGAVSGEMVAS